MNLSDPETANGGQVRVVTDIVYASRPSGDLLLDLYYPPRAQNRVPVVLWLHGGGWFTGDRTLAPDLARHAAATGCAVASIEYRLSGQALFPAQLFDVREAIRFLRAGAERLGLEPRAVGVWGASAGGHLAALAGLTGHLAQLPGEPATDGEPGAAVQAVAESYGPVDLAAVVAEAEATIPGMNGASSPEARLLGGHPDTLPDLARYASPLSWVSAAAPPFQISHGTGDTLVSHRQSELLHAALSAAGVSSELYLVDGYRHGFLNPPGLLDVQLRAVMDDGRLLAEEPAPSLRRTSAEPDVKEAGFGFEDIEVFFRRHLFAETPESTEGQPLDQYRS
ncbi:alpha/beta hydrolase [Arthrobacter sp. Sa2CUA1]|uniref:Alpha/beta hydrolase n=1 Tax=Arthrobacter gallicola TaxID=2762225 RepID=A0ABR8UUW1_9MICC|nr:alpha/beta hydrolase [Arthrobacter gallicola]MBD7996356.1 alpha/beta hydrolase [Arthrobacter gallicola]